MDDEFNTPRAVAVLHELAHEINRLEDKSSEPARDLAATLHHLGGVLGLLQDSPQAYLQGSVSAGGGLANDAIQDLIEQRNQARKVKKFTEADWIRQLLVQHGIVLEDTPAGTNWRRN